MAAPRGGGALRSVRGTVGARTPCTQAAALCTQPAAPCTQPASPRVQVRKADLRVRSLRRALEALAPDEERPDTAATDAGSALDRALRGTSAAMAASPAAITAPPQWPQRPSEPAAAAPTPQDASPAPLPACGSEATQSMPKVAAAASAGSFDAFTAKVVLLREWTWARPQLRPTAPSSAASADRAPPGAAVRES